MINKEAPETILSVKEVFKSMLVSNKNQIVDSHSPKRMAYALGRPVSWDR